MTLDTRIFIRGEVDTPQLFGFCNSLISGGRTGIRSCTEEDMLSNEPCQGLDAWLMLHQAGWGHAWLVPEGGHYRYCSPEDYEEGDGDPHDRCFPTFCEVSFDTAYSYQGPDGEGCGELHARLVTQLGQWLDAQGILWSWQNEFTGEVFERYEGLGELGGPGAQARAWFRDTVVPYIESVTGAELRGIQS